MREFKILVRGGYGFSNFGDDALMYTLHKELKTIELEDNISYICNKSSYLKRLIGKSEVIDFSDFHPESLHSNLLIYGGGTQFYEFPETSKKDLILKNILKNPKLIFVKIRKKINFHLKKTNSFDNKFELANSCANVALIGVGLGPFNENSSNSIFQKTKKLLQKSGFIGVRDIFASKKCEEWGIDYNYYTDICFALSEESLGVTNRSEKIKCIGVIIRDWKYANGGREYYDRLFSEVEDLRKKGFIVKFISFDKRADSEWHIKLSKAKEDFLLWDAENDSIEGFIEELKHFDFFITARYHGAIFSILLEKPFITIEVEQKLLMISNIFETGADCWGIPFAPKELLNKTLNINNNYSKSCDDIIENKIELQKKAQQMFSDFTDFYQTVKIDRDE